MLVALVIALLGTMAQAALRFGLVSCTACLAHPHLCYLNIANWVFFAFSRKFDEQGILRLFAFCSVNELARLSFMGSVLRYSKSTIPFEVFFYILFKHLQCLS
jgi:hypothetical protein